MTTDTVLYIHGFNSSPASLKARQLQAVFDAAGCGDRLRVPALPPQPKKAMAILDAELAAAGPVALAGSSLGGFYATWLAAHHDLKAVLINPAVRPWKLLDKYTGIQHNYHTGEAYTLAPGWVDELKHYAMPSLPQPENLLLLTQTGDETLNWQDGWDFYQDCHRYCGLGGNHSFEDFDAFIPLVLRFCGITLPS